MGRNTKRFATAALCALGLGAWVTMLGSAQSLHAVEPVAELQAAGSTANACGEGIPGAKRQRGVARIATVGLGTIPGGGPGGVIEILGMTHSVEVPLGAGGLPAGSAMRGPITITKEVDRASPLLMQALVTNDQVDSAKFQFYDGAGTNDYTIELEGAYVFKIDSSMVKRCDGGFAHLEKVGFVYTKIRYTHEPTGTSFQDSIVVPPVTETRGGAAEDRATGLR